jgi:hypothetical protein
VNKLLVPMTCLGLAGCAASGLEADGVVSAEALRAQQAGEVHGEASASPAEGSSPLALAGIREIDIQTYHEEETVCRTQAPTGSRIAVERCYVRVRNDSASDALARELHRQDFEEMRQRQMYQEQQQRAREQALRDRMMRSGQR